MIRIVGRETRTLESAEFHTVGEAFEKIGLSPQRYVPLINGNPCTSDRVIGEYDELVFIEVFSGG
ncbi:MAG: MoaD/ThiS family protein [Candidatus Thermoplasmatota archaeon]|nr:MoaD/ThiS family protein [Candidatus Thermoplasmatota archaeon]